MKRTISLWPSLTNFRGPADRGVLLASALGLLVACSPAEDVETTPATLCDGSADVRLTYYNQGGGDLDQEHGFFGAYGWEFLVIDGQCHYWAGDSYLKGVRSGSIDAAEADQIARKIHYGDFARLVPGESGTCPDATTVFLNDGVHDRTCSCSCASEGPALNRETYKNLFQIHEELFKRGSDLGGPIRVLATKLEGKGGSGGPATLAWPLAWPPGEATLAMDARPQADSGRLITDAADLATLRRLRADAVAGGSYTGIRVETTSGETFKVYPRDEAPELVAKALDRAEP